MHRGTPGIEEAAQFRNAIRVLSGGDVLLSDSDRLEK
jgi:hypothetical protein